MAVSTLDRVLYTHMNIAGFKSRHTNVRGCRMHHLEYRPKSGSEKFPIIFVHGLSSNAANWHRVLPALRRSGHPIFVPDLPSHGLSGDSEKGLCPDRLQEMFLGWSDSVVGTQALLVGNSLGGAVTLRHAQEQPAKALGVVALSPAGGFESEADWLAFKQCLTVSCEEDAGRFFERVLPGAPWYFSLVTPLIRQMILKGMSREGVRGLIRETHFSHFDVASRLKPFQMPILIVWGSREKLLPISNIEWFKRHLEGPIQIEEPPGLGHCPQLERPRWVTERILSFASSV